MVYGLDYLGEVSWNAPSVWEYELGIWRNYNAIKLYASISSFCSFPGHLQLLQTCIHHEYRHTFLLRRQFLLPCVIRIYLPYSGKLLPGNILPKAVILVFLQCISFRAGRQISTIMYLRLIEYKLFPSHSRQRACPTLSCSS